MTNDEIIEKAIYLSLYFNTRRGIGHTTTELNGILDLLGRLVVHDRSSINYTNHLAHRQLPNLIDFSSTEFQRELFTKETPLVIDHYVFFQIIEAYQNKCIKFVERIRHLEKRNQELEEIIQSMKESRDVEN